METVRLHSKEEIERFLRRDTALHLYALGDLDDFFWPYTTWYALKEAEQIQEVVLLYSATSAPTLLALTDHPGGVMPELLQSIIPLLPHQFYAHLSGELVNAFRADYQIQSYGLHHKMVLANPSRLGTVDTSEAIPLSASDLPDLEALYQASYPGNWFDPRMLETGFYYGVRRKEGLVSVAGIHVYSRQYQVAVLGNITTHPSYRGQGMATAVAARVCQALLSTVDCIGLNVHAGNASALACYQNLGFQRVAAYDEYSLLRYSSGGHNVSYGRDL